MPLIIHGKAAANNAANATSAPMDIPSQRTEAAASSEGNCIARTGNFTPVINSNFINRSLGRHHSSSIGSAPSKRESFIGNRYKEGNPHPGMGFISRSKTTYSLALGPTNEIIVAQMPSADTSVEQQPQQPVKRRRLSSGTREEVVVTTPYAQVLATLHVVKQNVQALLCLLPNEQSNNNDIDNGDPFDPNDKATATASSSEVADGGKGAKSDQKNPRQIVETAVNQLEWCLEQLEAVQSHKTVSDLACDKFRRMMQQEMKERGHSKSAEEVAIYILNVFTNGKEKEIYIKARVENNSCDLSGPMPSPTSKMLTKTGSNENEPLPLHGILMPQEKTFEQLLSTNLNIWGLDMFSVNNVTGGHPITPLFYTIFKERGFIQKFSIDPRRLVSYFLELENNYRPNPYHNAIHGADVAHSVHVMLSWPPLSNIFSDLEKMAAIFAAAIHDVDHPGLQSSYLIYTGAPLALLYNDEAVLEQHHVSVAYRLLQNRGCDFLEPLSKSQRTRFRKLVIQMVMATDMSKHGQMVAAMRTTIEAEKVKGIDASQILGTAIEPELVLQNLIHFADLSNPMKAFHIYEEWTKRLMEEYWAQGDQERARGMKISALCDRHDVNISKGQLWFMDFVVYPLCEVWSDFLGAHSQVFMDNLVQNRERYLESGKDSPSSGSVEQNDDI